MAIRGPDTRERLKAYLAPFENSVDGVLITNPDGTIYAANRAACQILGYTEDEIRALGRQGITDEADGRWEEAAETRRRTGAFKGQLCMRRADGSTFVAETSSGIFEDDGRERAHVIFSDGSESADLLRQAAAEIELAELVVDTLESINDGYFAVDDEWCISYVNHHAEKLLKVSRRDVFGRNLWETFPEAQGTDFQERYETVRRTGQADTFEAYYATLDLHCEVRAYPLRGGGLGVYFLDIADRKLAQRERETLLAAEREARTAAEHARVELAHRASHDDLTGLLNRSGLVDRVGRNVAATPDAPVTVMLIDLDRFKLVNDTLGHATGDELLAAFARRLRGVVGPFPLLGRFGGDEFVVAMVGDTVAQADELARRIIAMSTEPITIGTNVLLATATVGIAHTDDGTDLGRLLREADAAMYSAKDAGRERAAWFDQRLHVQALHRMQVEQELRIALTGGDQMLSHYQPAFDLVHGGALHVEALARWRHPRRGLVPPGGFIGVAEETGLITSIGEVILAQAVAQAGQWLDVPDLRVWVNVSPRQLAVPGLRDMLALHLGRAGVPPERFGIEVTESVMAERGRFTSELEAVHDLGVAIAIDDFGTGYSSLARLSTTPFDVIKIDRSFVAQLGTPTGDALVTGIVTLAHSIGAHVIAEGVETAAQLHQVAASGCDAAAGYFMARPGSAEAVPLSIEIGERGLGAQERLVERPDDTVGARFVNRLR